MNKEVTVKIPEYSKEKGLQFLWEMGFEINVVQHNSQITIHANKEGLLSLARILLSLVQNEVPDNYTIHLDDSNSLEDGSAELIFHKIKK